MKRYYNINWNRIQFTLGRLSNIFVSKLESENDETQNKLCILQNSRKLKTEMSTNCLTVVPPRP